MPKPKQGFIFVAMLMRLYIRVKTWFLHQLVFPLADYLAMVQRPEPRPKTLLLLRMDAIGDYILFRNFLAVIKAHPVYRNYKITLCGNIIWKSLSETIDADKVDGFIWIDRKKLVRNPIYRFKTMQSLNRQGFEQVVQSAYMRDYFVDTIVKAVKPKLSIANAGGTGNATGSLKARADALFNELIPASPEPMFEFYRNSEFFKHWLGNEIVLPNKPEIDFKTNLGAGLAGVSENYIVIFPGAGAPFRQWGASNYARIAEWLEKFGYRIVIAGSKADHPIGEAIQHHGSHNHFFNLCGQTNLPKLVSLVAGATLLISGDTGAYHIAAACQTPAVCISNGNHYGIFLPYPAEMNLPIRYVFPPEIEALTESERIERYSRISHLKINSIQAATVRKAIRELLPNLERV